MKKIIIFLFLTISFLSSCSRNPNELYNLALSSYSNKDYPDSIRYLKKIILKYPRSSFTPKAMKLMGDIFLYNLSQEKTGIEVLLRVTKYFPQATEAALASYEIAEYHFEKGEYERTIPFLRRILNYPAPRSIKENTLHMLIYSHYFTEDYEDTLSYINKFLTDFKNSRNFWEITLLKVQVMEEEGEDGEAEKILKNVIERAPDKFKSEATINLSNLYTRKENFREALILLYKLRNQPKHSPLIDKKIKMLESIIYNKHRFK